MKTLIFILISLFTAPLFAQESAESCSSYLINDVHRIWRDGVTAKKRVSTIEGDFRDFFSANKSCVTAYQLSLSISWLRYTNYRLPRMIYQAAFDTIDSFSVEDAQQVCRYMDIYQNEPYEHLDEADNPNQENFENKVYQRVCHARYIRRTATKLTTQNMLDLMGMVDADAPNPYLSNLTRKWGDLNFVKKFWRSYDRLERLSQPGYVCRLMYGNTSKMRGDKVYGHFTYSFAGLCAKEFFRSFHDLKKEALAAGHYSLSPAMGGAVCSLTHDNRMTNDNVFLPTTRLNRCLYEFAIKFIRYASDKERFKDGLLEYVKEARAEEIEHMSKVSNPTDQWSAENTIELISNL